MEACTRLWAGGYPAMGGLEDFLAVSSVCRTQRSAGCSHLAHKGMTLGCFNYFLTS